MYGNPFTMFDVDCLMDTEIQMIVESLDKFIGTAPDCIALCRAEPDEDGNPPKLRTDCVDTLESACKNAEAILARIRDRAARIPNSVPYELMLLKIPFVRNETFDVDSTLGKELSSAKSYRGDNPEMIRTLTFNDPTYHPLMHLRRFAREVENSRGEVYVVVAADAERVIYAPRQYQDGPSMLYYDWAMPINWRLDLLQYQLKYGCHSGMPAYEAFHSKCNSVFCLQWARNDLALEGGAKYMARLNRPRYAIGRWLLHLKAPFVGFSNITKRRSR